MREVYDRRALQLSAILRGLIGSFIILIAASLILGILFSIMDTLVEEVANRILLVLNYAAIFGGGIYTARKTCTKGWLNGGLVGLLYMVVVLTLGSQYAENVTFLEILLRVLSGFIAGAIGGVLGVNLR